MQPVTFAARDGYSLGGLLVWPEGTPRAGLLVTGGTGFKLSFYRSFAADAAAHGFVVLLFDPRGFGTSAPDDLAAMTMDYTDWGRLDAPAALDRLAEAAPGLPLGHVAHSVGGHFVGLWDNQALVQAHAFACVGSGYWRDHTPLAQLRELYFWHVYGPWSLRRHGFIARGGGWTGAPVPRGVFETWRRWCHHPGYLTEELGAPGALERHYYTEVTAPIRSWIYTDDPIANPKTGPAILDLYSKAATELVIRSPENYRLRKIGHNGPFAKDKGALRGELLDWLSSSLVGH
jgi:predicted alpha/beta hydrolase